MNSLPTIQEWFAKNMLDGENIGLNVRFTREGVRRFESQNWKVDELNILEDGTGLLETSIDEKDLAFYARYFLGFGTDALILTPERLKQAMLKEIERIKELYV